MQRSLLVVLASTVVGCAPSGPTEQYGFVTLLGRDTVAVERVYALAAPSDDRRRRSVAARAPSPLRIRSHPGRQDQADGHGCEHAQRSDAGGAGTTDHRRLLQRSGEDLHSRLERDPRHQLRDRRRPRGSPRLDDVQRDRTGDRLRARACGWRKRRQGRRRHVPAVLSRSRHRPELRAAQGSRPSRRQRTCGASTRLAGRYRRRHRRQRWPTPYVLRQAIDLPG